VIINKLKKLVAYLVLYFLGTTFIWLSVVFASDAPVEAALDYFMASMIATAVLVVACALFSWAWSVVND
jgi:hypothetical protein